MRGDHMKDFPKGHIIVPVTIGGTTKNLCLSCGNNDLGKDGQLPKKVTPEMAANALKHRLEHGRCEECWPAKEPEA
jgi:hypothetical protein